MKIVGAICRRDIRFDLRSKSLALISSWYENAFGTIIYFNDYMSVSINCPADIEKRVFYSGPYRIDGETVVHNVRNYSDVGLNQVFRRGIVMPDRNHLALVGTLTDGGKATISWKRR